MEEKDDLRQFFAGFSPDLPSDNLFMERLKRGMDAVEIVKRRNELQMAATRRAVKVAAVTGFITGVIFAFALPYLTSLISAMIHSLADGNAKIIETLGEYPVIPAGMIAAATVLILSKNAYDLSIAISRRASSGC